MTQKQYDDMETIMKFGRIFSEAMQKAMEHCGLLGKGFYLQVNSEEIEFDDGEKITGCVRLCRTTKPGLDPDCDYYADDMVQMRLGERGWMVANDPYAKAGTLPPDVKIDKNFNDVYPRHGKASSKPYPPNGYWISSLDDCPFLDGGK